MKLQKEIQRLKSEFAKDKALISQEVDHYKLERDDIAE